MRYYIMRSDIEAVIEMNEFVSAEFSANESNIAGSYSIAAKNEQKKSQDFSAGAGLFIVVSLFFMFFLVPVAALISVGFNINLLPIAITIMTSTAIVASFYLLLRVIDTSFK